MLNFEGALLRSREFLALESPLRIVENAVYFTLKALSILKIFKLFG